ncbi:hypothetical protein BDD12DRAFT_863239 [Trichophaea hybrida]|nr:hypothetical protein BDD12DRAFT_863239 [Trichophaea hybrida]
MSYLREKQIMASAVRISTLSPCTQIREAERKSNCFMHVETVGKKGSLGLTAAEKVYRCGKSRCDGWKLVIKLQIILK